MCLERFDCARQKRTTIFFIKATRSRPIAEGMETVPWRNECPWQERKNGSSDESVPVMKQFTALLCVHCLSAAKPSPPSPSHGKQGPCVHPYYETACVEFSILRNRIRRNSILKSFVSPGPQTRRQKEHCSTKSTVTRNAQNRLSRDLLPHAYTAALKRNLTRGFYQNHWC